MNGLLEYLAEVAVENAGKILQWLVAVGLAVIGIVWIWRSGSDDNDRDSE